MLNARQEHAICKGPPARDDDDANGEWRVAGGDGYGRMVVVPTFAFNKALRTAAMDLPQCAQAQIVLGGGMSRSFCFASAKRENQTDIEVKACRPLFTNWVRTDVHFYQIAFHISRGDQPLPVFSTNGATWSAGPFYPILWIASENRIRPVCVQDSSSLCT
ncbi:hypothetical protein DBV15_07016 [Temnothorax longispinosus]|uniref:Uncharacterized protein n=1 Tax=Temnothorax longispinosus TaxID=300112 RepID=A0A4S2JDG7_9HYME|nr:hypothetical protein DBV15_07016 [Temnothorax longispinosus]